MAGRYLALITIMFIFVTMLGSHLLSTL